jgi:hypothetical protein
MNKIETTTPTVEGDFVSGKSLVDSSASGGFKYNVEHLRKVSVMEALGLSIEGLDRKIFSVEEDGVVVHHDVVVLSIENVSNLIPEEGIGYILGAALKGVSQISSWFIALFEGNYTPVAGVTAATFPAAATESTAYAEANRVAWTSGSVSGGSVSNTASKAVFTMNATKTIYGIAQTSLLTKSGTTGTLVSVARFAAAKSVVADDILNVTSTITLTSA